MTKILKPFIELPYGTKFRYQGSEEVWVRTQHNVIAGWSPSLIQFGRQSLCAFCHLEGDEDGNTLQTLVEVVGDQPAQQHQGEPVAWMDPREPKMHATISNEVKQHNVKLGGAPASAVNCYTIPLYAHADPAEVERLNSLLRASRTSLDNCALQIENLQAKLADLEALRADFEEADAHLKACREDRDIAEHQRNVLRAQLGEREAILCRVKSLIYQQVYIDDSDWDDIARALSTSAEPSAPAEIDERAAFETFHRKHLEASGMDKQDIDSEFDRKENGDYIYVMASDAWPYWQARAALERKP